MTLLVLIRINDNHFCLFAYYTGKIFIQSLVGDDLLKLDEARPVHRAGASKTPDDFNTLMNSDPGQRPSGGMTTSPTE